MARERPGNRQARERPGNRQARERPGNRQARERLGRSAETLAALLLRLKGYRILARRVRTPSGEIDLVVRRGRTIAFVEVKARSTEAAAIESVSHHQRRRIVRAAAHFVSGRSDLAGTDQRFDAVLVTPGRLPRHLVSVWTESAD